MAPTADFRCDACGAVYELELPQDAPARPHEDSSGNKCNGSMQRVWSFRTLRGSTGEPPR